MGAVRPSASLVECQLRLWPTSQRRNCPRAYRSGKSVLPKSTASSLPVLWSLMILRPPDRSSWLLSPFSTARGLSNLMMALASSPSYLRHSYSLISSHLCYYPPPAVTCFPPRPPRYFLTVYFFCSASVGLVYSRYMYWHRVMTICTPFIFLPPLPSRFTLHIFYFASCFRIIRIRCMTYCAMPHSLFSF